MTWLTILTFCALNQGMLPQTEVFRLPTDVSQLLERRGKEISTLAATLQDINAPAAKRFSAAYALGEIRAEQAVTDIAPFIAINDAEKIGMRHGVGFPLWGDYPAAEALAKIGLGSFKAMRSILATSDNELDRKQALNVICSTYARHLELPIARKLAELTVSEWCMSEADAKRRDRLFQALLAIRQGEPWQRPDTEKIVQPN